MVIKKPLISEWLNFVAGKKLKLFPLDVEFANHTQPRNNFF